MNRVQRKFVIDALDQDEKLTEWEHGFLTSLRDKDIEHPHIELSERQNEILNAIQRKLD